MSNDKHRVKGILTLSGGARRRFLQDSALAAAGIAAATVLPSTARGDQVTSSARCPEVPTPLRDVKGKVAFITGGSSGIGLGMARAFADAGMKVVIGYRTTANRDQAMEELKDVSARIHTINVDVTDRLGMQNAAGEVVKTFGKVHLLVNNAGVHTGGPLSSASFEDWQWMMTVNLEGVFNGIQAFLPHIRAHGEGGQIVSTSSIWGLVAISGAAIYSASKAAVIALSEALRGELAESNIGVSVYCPGGVSSRGWDASRNRPNHLKDAGDIGSDEKKRAENEQLVKRLTQTQALMDPRDAGRLVLRGIRQNDLYIFSHPEYDVGIRDRSEALLAAIPADVPVPEARLASERSTLTNRIYAIERDRKRCANSHSARSDQ